MLCSSKPVSKAACAAAIVDKLLNEGRMQKSKSMRRAAGEMTGNVMAVEDTV